MVFRIQCYLPRLPLIFGILSHVLEVYFLSQYDLLSLQDLIPWRCILLVHVMTKLRRVIHIDLVDFWLPYLQSFSLYLEISLNGLCYVFSGYDSFNTFLIESMYPLSYVGIVMIGCPLLISGILYPSSLSRSILAR